MTDDSDAFAFGGRAVYKNIFNEKKFVEAYLLPDAEKVRRDSIYGGMLCHGRGGGAHSATLAWAPR